MQPGADPCLRFIVAHFEDATYRLVLGPNAPPCDEGAHRVLHRNEGNGRMGRRRPKYRDGVGLVPDSQRVRWRCSRRDHEPTQQFGTLP